MWKVMSSLLAVVSLAVPLRAHKGKHHAPAERPAVGTLEEINALYIKDVRAIFRQKCFDCHGTPERLPWYAAVPGVKQLIERDMREAKVHVDMRRDFPFGGHGSPLEDLDALADTLADGSMPPLRYRVMHRGSKLTAAESERIRAWVEASRAGLLR